jgi:hypothetical protein
MWHRKNEEESKECKRMSAAYRDRSLTAKRNQRMTGGGGGGEWESEVFHESEDYDYRRGHANETRQTEPNTRAVLRTVTLKPDKTK